jgi:hypothetical protein
LDLYEYDEGVVGSWIVTVYINNEEASTLNFQVEKMSYDPSTGNGKEDGNGTGIPGFQIESILLGLFLGIIIIWLFQRN